MKSLWYPGYLGPNSDQFSYKLVVFIFMALYFHCAFLY